MELSDTEVREIARDLVSVLFSLEAQLELVLRYEQRSLANVMIVDQSKIRHALTTLGIRTTIVPSRRT
jgi:hypothetical protein